MVGIKFYGNESAKSGNVTAREGGGAITEHFLSFLALRRGIQMSPGLIRGGRWDLGDGVEPALDSEPHRELI